MENKKKRKKTGQLSLLLLCVLCLTRGAVPVKAADKSVQIRIPVSCTGTDTTERFHYELEGGESEYEQVDTGRLTLSDGEEGNFVITCNYPGTYHYTVRQAKGTDEQTTYDDTVYQVEVYVTENDEGQLAATSMAYIAGDTEKRDVLRYQNSKEKVQQPEKPQAQPTEPQAQPEKATEYLTGPKTGDETNWCLWLMLAVSCTGTAGMLWLKKNQWGKEDA